MKKKELVKFWTEQFCEQHGTPVDEMIPSVLELIKDVMDYTIDKIEDKYKIEL